MVEKIDSPIGDENRFRTSLPINGFSSRENRFPDRGREPFELFCALHLAAGRENRFPDRGRERCFLRFLVSRLVVEKIDSPIGDENFFSSCFIKSHFPVEKIDSPIGDENEILAHSVLRTSE